MVDEKRPADGVPSLLEVRITRRRALAFMGLAGAAAFLAACGSTSTTPVPSAPAGSPAAGASAATGASAAPAPSSGGAATGGTVVIGAEDQLSADLDPRSGTDLNSFFVKGSCFQTLLNLDPKSGDITPGLAAALPTMVDNLTWELKLRPGVLWHDGTTMTAKDVKYTLDKINDKTFNSLFINTYNFISSADAVDDTTIRFHLSQPFGAFLDRMTAFAPVPMAAAEAQGYDTFKRKPVGNGPWMVSNVVPDQSITIVPFDKWTGPKPSLASVTWKYIPDGSARIAALQTSAVDITVSVPPELFKVIGTGGVTTGTLPSTSYDGILFNCGKPPFDNKLVRQAVAHGIDRDEIIQVAWGGQATPAWGPLPPWHWATNPDGLKLDHDPAKSMALLTQAGVKMPLEFELTGYNSGPLLLMATTIQAQLQKAGFAPTLKLVDSNAAYAGVDDKSWQAFNFYGDTGLLGLDPDIWYRWLEYGTFTNSPASENQQFITAIDAAAQIASSDKPARLKAYYALQDLLADQERIVHIDGRNVFNAWRDDIHGYVPTYNNVPNMTVVSKG